MTQQMNYQTKKPPSFIG